MRPQSFARRSPIHHALQAEGAVFAPLPGGDAAVAAHYDDPAAERAAAGRLALADLSPLPRMGLKGRDTFDWLRAEGASFEPVPNRAFAQDGGGLLALLSMGEALALAGPDGASPLVAAMAALPAATPGRLAYPLPRGDSHYAFALAGPLWPEVLATLCGVDLRPAAFASGAVAQTSLARSNAILVRHPGDDDKPLFSLLGDSASADYIWSCLRRAMAPHAGRLVGTEALTGDGGSGTGLGKNAH
ncbi:MAG: hypothetical protein KDG89_02735 [Geminicoccaceae bacterium]|nr:hypothetical protein [Geminicoccaceae bacterium]